MWNILKNLNLKLIKTLARFFLLFCILEYSFVLFAQSQAAPTGSLHASNVLRALFFAPEDNQISVTSPQVEWSFAKDSDLITINGLDISGSDIGVEFFWQKNDPHIRIFWPQNLIPNPKFDILNSKNQIIGQLESSKLKKLTNSKKQIWVEWALPENDLTKEILDFKKNTLKADSKIKICAQQISQTIEKPKSSNKNFKFTQTQITQSSQPLKIQFCSSTLEFTAQNKAQQIIKAKASKNDQGLKQIFINNQKYSEHGVLTFDNQLIIDFKIIFQNSSVLEFQAQSPHLKIYEISWNEDQSLIRAIGHGAKPSQSTRDLYIPRQNFWEPTHDEDEYIWQYETPKESPVIPIPGPWGFSYHLLISFKDLPQTQDHIFLEPHTPEASFIEHPTIYLQNYGNQKDYAWQLNASQKHEFNTQKLELITPDSKKWIANYQIFRSGQIELGARLTGIIADTQNLLLGEVRASYWAESLFNIHNYKLSQQRWGLSFAYYKSISDVNLPNTESLTPFEVIHSELHYNLNSGIWNHDQLVGLSLGVQSLKLGTHSGSFLGMGFYWSRLLPHFFDEIFNIIPFLRYPKYTDLEFIYYPLSVSSQSQSPSLYSMDFHGKVFWRPNIYGDAGFGIKNIDFIENSTSSSIAFSAGYATIGLGWIF